LLNKHLSASIPSPIAYNNNVSKDFADLVKGMMAKSPADRPQSLWEFLKDVRNMQLFVKRPRRPEISVFDNLPGIRGADDMIRKPSRQDIEADEEAER
jgi:serine/threonine protein kinase